MTETFSRLGDQIFTVPEVARYLKISKAKIYYLVSKDKIPHLKIGRNIRIQEKDFQKWMDENKSG